MVLMIGAYSLLLFLFALLLAFRFPEAVVVTVMFGIFYVEGMLGGLFGASHNATLILTSIEIVFAVWLYSRNTYAAPGLKFLSSAEWLYGILLLLMWASWMYTPTPEYGMYKLQKLTLTLLPTVMVGRLCFSTPQSARTTVDCLAYFSLLMIPWVILYWLVWANQQGDDSRFSGGAAIVLGNVLVISVFVALYILQTNRKLFAVALMAVAFWSAMLLLSGSRSAILGLGVAMVITLARFRTMFRLIGMAVILLVIGLAVYRFLPQYNEGISRLSDTDLEGTARPALFTAAINIFLDHPVRGTGVGGFADYTVGDKRDYPHNLMLEVLSEQGIIGGSVLGVLYVAGLWKYRKIRRMNFASREDKAYLQPVLQVAMLTFMLGVCQSMVTADSPMFYILYFGTGAMWGCATWIGSFEKEALVAWESPLVEGHSLVKGAL